ncbi:MAG: M1 family metallopeptidase [Bergeyella sp.]|nr:M1 family metallopeptidase [Bergeyella sp.]
MKRIVFNFFLVLSQAIFSQNFSKIDTLKGSDTSFRNFWKVSSYEFTVEPDYKDLSVSGENKIFLYITKDIEDPIFQIDLQQPMNYKFLGEGKEFYTKRDGDFIFVHGKGIYKKGKKLVFRVRYFGHPIIARNAPWDGGWVFKTDDHGNPFMSVAQEGIGVSVWLPVKDTWSEEPENGIKMTIITPKGFTGVGNGRLIKKKNIGEKQAYTWQVKNPINLYDISPTVGKFTHFGEIFLGEKGKLDLDFWVLSYNLEKAKKHFTQVKPMLKIFEYWLGPYPFYEDSYKLVESPYLGMEHQSNIAYGNHYIDGYLGRDISGTGYGLGWDYIIVHESGHEWFANNITAKDVADMWIHESFTTYSEVLFVNEYIGKQEGNQYAIGLRGIIENKKPIEGIYGVRKKGSADMYSKGANMIHTLRHVLNDDEKFRNLLRSLNQKFYHKTVTRKEFVDYINITTGVDFTSFFHQYLDTTDIPTLAYRVDGNKLSYVWKNTVPRLYLPIRIKQKDKEITITPSDKVQHIELPEDADVECDPNYYIFYSKESV